MFVGFPQQYFLFSNSGWEEEPGVGVGWFLRPHALLLCAGSGTKHHGIIIPPPPLREILPEEVGKFVPSELAECLSVHEVDDEVKTGVTDQRQVVQTGQTEEPVRGDKHLWAAPLHFPRHDNLVAVEDDPGDVATAEEGHDAGDDEGAVDLTLHTQPAAAVRKSKSQK